MPLVEAMCWITYMLYLFTPMIVMAKIKELIFISFPHPPYSPALTPSDFCFFANLKSVSFQKDLWTVKVWNFVKGCFEDLDKLAYKSSIIILKHHWRNCIKLNGDYGKKWNQIKKMLFSYSGLKVFTYHHVQLLTNLTFYMWDCYINN